MPVGNNDNHNSRFANIRKGKVIIKEGDEYKEYGYIEGTITDIQIIEDEYKGKKYKKVCVFLHDGIEGWNFQFRLDSGYGRAFCNTIENADLSKHIKFTPNWKEVDGKDVTTMFLAQGANALKWAHTRDNPGELPDLEKITVRGEDMWDNTKQQAFYTNLLLDVIKPKLVHPVMVGSKNQIDAAEPAGPGTEAAAEDDLPF